MQERAYKNKTETLTSCYNASLRS